MIHRGFAYRLEPTAGQAQTLREWVGATRYVYNLCLEQRRDFWRQYRRMRGHPLTWIAQSREVTELRRQVDWIGAVPRAALERALKDLDAAFVNFFSGRAALPKPRAKGQHDSFRLQAKDVSIKRLNAKWSSVRLPNLGWVKFRDTRPRVGRQLSLTVSLCRGIWHVVFAHQIEHEAAAANGPSVGIDRGVVQTLALSTGEIHQAPDAGRITKRRKRAQRALARRNQGSRRYAAQRLRVAALRARMARQRTDWCHRTSTDIARRFGFVAIEDLKIINMTASASAKGRAQKAGLNRSILEQCWGKFAIFLDYKLAERGGHLISVPPHYTSQTCSACGVVDARSRKSQAVFHCVHCDHTDNADVNAAKEILRRSTAWLDVEGPRLRPDEASIMAVAA